MRMPAWAVLLMACCAALQGDGLGQARVRAAEEGGAGGQAAAQGPEAADAQGDAILGAHRRWGPYIALAAAGTQEDAG